MKRFIFYLYGIVSYSFFLVVFLYAIGFVGNFGVPKSIDSGAAGPVVPALIINMLLLALFAVQHSIMARPGFKKWWTKIVPEAVERTTFVFFSSAILALLFWQWQPMPEAVWNVTFEPAILILWAVCAVGWLTVLASTFMISHAHLFGLKQVHKFLRKENQPPLEFDTPALYRYVRHPIMLGFLVAFWATPHMSEGHLLFAVATTGYILLALQFEERDLVKLFGDRYIEYRKRVRMLIPVPKRSRVNDTTPEYQRPSGYLQEKFNPVDNLKD